MTDPDTYESSLKNLLEALMRSSMRGFVRFAKERGLSMTQFNTLVFLHHKGPSAVTDIADELGVSSAAASQMLDRLVQEGYITRTEDQRDRRLKKIVLTEKGEELLDQGLDARQQWIKKLGEALSSSEKDQLATAFNLMISKMSQTDIAPDDAKN